MLVEVMSKITIIISPKCQITSTSWKNFVIKNYFMKIDHLNDFNFLSKEFALFLNIYLF